MFVKKISLLMVAVLSIVLLFCIPFYNNWLNTKFDHELDRDMDELQHLSPEERFETRFGTTYVVLHAISNMLHSVKASNVVVLLPPRDYVKANRTEEGTFEVPEPAVFYYFTGYKAVDRNSPEATTASWALIVENHKMAMKPLRSRQFLDSLLIAYKRYN